jgi:hypothetical protein
VALSTRKDLLRQTYNTSVCQLWQDLLVSRRFASGMWWSASSTWLTCQSVCDFLAAVLHRLRHRNFS